jgi:hypothetical protein
MFYFRRAFKKIRIQMIDDKRELSREMLFFSVLCRN